MHKQIDLQYIIYKPRVDITLNLYEAERYEPAIIVQSLIGNLVYFSNQGRYEPRLAKTWQRLAPNKWKFDLLPNLYAQNGEPITPTSFKKSIERTLKFLSKKEGFPILMYLSGFREFMDGASELKGIKAEDNALIFEFDQPVRDGLLQVLSFAPFGYIASENLNEDGSWRDDLKFVSSGPYRVVSVEKGKRYVLQKRQDWVPGFAENSPETIEFSHTIPDHFTNDGAYILDTFMATIEPPTIFQKYPLVPEYLNPILLGNLQIGYFSDVRVRNQFKELLNKHRSELPAQIGAHSRSRFFYPSQAPQAKSVNISSGIHQKPMHPLIIEGEEPLGSSTDARSIAWKVLKGALEEANLPFRFAQNKTTMKSLGDAAYDIRIRGASTGAGAEAWGLKILFCSELGPRFPDPGLHVCNLIERYEADKISEADFAQRFSQIVEDDAAIIPITHYGIQLYVSPRIKTNSLSPTLAVMRFDQLEVEAQ
jgi:MarR-like DNA-binding transcriptional regulator SgrR of sgrS sRNA